MNPEVPPLGEPWWLIRDGEIIMRGRIESPPDLLVNADLAEGTTAVVIRGSFTLEPGDRIMVAENPRWVADFHRRDFCWDGVMTIPFAPGWDS